MPKLQTFGWCSVHEITPQCADCAHVVEEGRMCCCDLNFPGFPMLAECPEFDPEAA